MAQKVNIVLVDDIDGSEAEETVTFGLDGSTYEIDLNNKNASGLRDALSGYVGHARKVGGRRTATAGRKATSGNGSGPSAAEIREWARASAAEIREWARANGHDVPERGRVSADVRSAYEAAH